MGGPERIAVVFPTASTLTITVSFAATKEVSKAFNVSQTKRANNKLKVVGEACLNLAQHRDTRPPGRIHKLINASLDRELKALDSAGPDLRVAVKVFWIRGDEQTAIEVYERVRQVQRDRWRQVEAKHGKNSHYFDPFGQIKPRYPGGMLCL